MYHCEAWVSSLCEATTVSGAKARSPPFNQWGREDECGEGIAGTKWMG